MAFPDWTKTLVESTASPGASLPDWIMPFFSPYENEVRTATHIKVHRDEASPSTFVMAYLPDGRHVGVRITDETLASLPFDTSFLVPFKPPLPIVSSPYPILGWRQWKMGSLPPIGRKEGMFGLFGQHWETPLMQARCARGHSAPWEGCRCGIYLTKDNHEMKWSESYAIGLVVATNLIEHEYGYRAGLVRCIAITAIHPKAHGWDGIPIMSPLEQQSYAASLREDLSLIPYPDDLPAP